MAEVAEIPRQTLEALTYRSSKRSHDFFLEDQGKPVAEFEEGRELKLACKVAEEYAHVPTEAAAAKGPSAQVRAFMGKAALALTAPSKPMLAIGAAPAASAPAAGGSGASSALVSVPSRPGAGAAAAAGGGGAAAAQAKGQLAVVASDSGARGALVAKAPSRPKPQWHPHWKLHRVISGHQGWVRCVAVDPTNQWFATGSADRTIKIWDLASGTLKLSLTGHISAVRGLVVSDRHPYLFSCGEDKSVKCWDLETNKVIRHYHGHLSAIYACALHPTLDILFTGGRDCTVRVWDIRTKAQVHCLTGHTNTVGSMFANSVDPQIVSGSHDSTIRLWDLAAGRSISTLTNHKKSVRAMAMHPKEFTFASGAPDNIKQWYLPDGKFIQNCNGHDAIVNCLAVNPDGVMISGADNGSLCFWDYKTGTKFQSTASIAQPGSLDSEAGVFAMAFDRSYSRLITTESDKSIKVYREDPLSTEETHPVVWQPEVLKRDRF